jgi:hypothetical protein
MALAHDRGLRRGESVRGAAGEADEQLELGVGRPNAGRRIADREDPEQLGLRAVERDEDLVVPAATRPGPR